MVQRVKLYIVLSIFLLTLVACDTNDSTASTPVQSQSADSEPTGQIVFQSNRNNGLSLYIMDADGENVDRITQERDSHPNLSSTGQIVYESAIDGQNDIFTLSDRDDNTPANLTNTDDTWEYFPMWSPDNSLIVYVSDWGGDEEIWVMDADGGNPTQLTDNDTLDTAPAWSPSGKQIIFQSNRDGDNDLYIMTIDGEDVVQLTDNDDEDIRPIFSPDKTAIAFVSDRDGNNEIYIMNPDGTLPTRLTDNDIDDGHPTWSPDGTWIAYHSTDGTNVDIYIMRADGTDIKRLTDVRGTDSDPSWNE